MQHLSLQTTSVINQQVIHLFLKYIIVKLSIISSVVADKHSHHASLHTVSLLQRQQGMNRSNICIPPLHIFTC